MRAWPADQQGVILGFSHRIRARSRLSRRVDWQHPLRLNVYPSARDGGIGIGWPDLHVISSSHHHPIRQQHNMRERWARALD